MRCLGHKPENGKIYNRCKSTHKGVFIFCNSHQKYWYTLIKGFVGITVTIFGLIAGYFGLMVDAPEVLNQKKIAEKELQIPNTIKQNFEKPVFPNTKVNDSLYVLITRFEESKRDTINKNNCVGYSISNRIDQLIYFKKLPVKCIYNEDITPPRKIETANKIQQFNNADILIWGFSTNFKEECGIGDVCFMSSPSENMIKTAGGNFVSPTKLEIKYEKIDTKKIQEKGTELHVNGFIFESWLSNMVF